MNFFKKIITGLLALICIFSANAQSSGDRLYNQGLELQKVQTIQSQKNAITKFKSAKKLYDSKTKKDQCDKAIAVSNNIIKSLTPTKNNSKSKQVDLPVDKLPVLELSGTKYNVGNEAITFPVNVTVENIEDWTAIPVVNSDGSSFITANVSPEESVIWLYCQPNTITTPRTQIVEVSGGGIKKEIIVNQSGIPIILTSNKTILDFKKKGSKDFIIISSNCSEDYGDNNGENWYVSFKPDWINIGIEVESKNFVQKIFGGKNSSEIVGSSTLKTANIAVIADKIPKGSADYDTGRKGEIIITAGDKSISITVVQK